MTPELSIIIPVYHEAHQIQAQLEHIESVGRGVTYEVIVVDGDPAASTLTQIGPDCEHIQGVTAGKGRGSQMNAGAQLAQGHILLFLHVDTRLPDQALQQVQRICHETQSVGGAFDLAIASERMLFKVIGRIASVRSRLTRIPYGDQAIFIRRDIFEAIQGYPNIPIMEDVALMERLKRHRYRIQILPNTVQTSPRRWEKEGILRCTLRNWLLMLLYRVGMPPAILANWYRPQPESGQAEQL